MNRIVRDGNRFLICCGESGYAFEISEAGLPVNLHWGAAFYRLADAPSAVSVQQFLHRVANRSAIARQEYPAWYGALFTEPALKVSDESGVRNCELRFVDAELLAASGCETLTVKFTDRFHRLEVVLFYRVYSDCDLVDRWSVITNAGDKPCTLESVQSATLQLPQLPRPYRVTGLHGRWGREGMIGRTVPGQGKFTLESRSGLSGANAMPFFALDQGDASETAGEVWFGSLQWSGSWKIVVDGDGYGDTSVTAGIHDFDFSWQLAPGASFTTPELSCGYTRGGFGAMTRIIHRYLRARIEPEEFRRRPMPLLVNTYAALNSGPEMNETNAMKQLEAAAKVGAELFVFDAGWQQSLGEWTPHREKFPNGLQPFAARAHELGMKFGVWAELESVDLNGRLYAEHPDWIMKFPGPGQDDPMLLDGRSDRVLLNFARDEVLEFIWEAMDRLIGDNRLDYFKLDMNRAFSRPGWDVPPDEGARSIWVRYVWNIRELFARIRRKYPQIMLENCAQGNGRADWGFMRYFERVNRSDNQDPLDELRLHEGFSIMHLPKWAGGGCHISDYTSHINRRRVPVQFQAFAGMLGSLAIGRRLHESSEAELLELRRYGELYKQIRHITNFGDFYRLISHFDSNYAVYEYVTADASEAVVFFFGHALQYSGRPPLVALRGLEPEAVYELTSFGGESATSEWKAAGATNLDVAEILNGRRVSGAGLMAIGLRAELYGDFASRLVHLKRVE